MKHLTGFLSLFLFAVLPLSAADLSDLTYTTTNGEVTITDCDEAATGALVIPDTIEGNPVRSIGPQAFRECRSLASITIPDSVTSIQERAFYYCTNLTSITIPDSVTSIGNDALRNCTGLTSITISNSVTSIGEGAFENCRSLTNITIPDGVTSIGGYAFAACTSLTSITIPDGVTSIGRVAFRYCTSLTSITIPDGVTSIGGYAFANCTSLTSITIPDSVTSIGLEAFDGTDELSLITLPGSVTMVERYTLAPNQLAAQLATVTAERDAAIAERDARPTAEALVAVEAERDAILSDIQLAYDEVTAAAGGAEADLVEVVDPENAPSEVQSVGVVAQPLDAFEVNTLDSPNNLDTELGLYDTGGNLVVSNDDAGPALQSQLNFSDGLAGGVYYLAVGTFDSTFNSDFAVSSAGRGGEYTLTLPTGQVSGTLEPSGFDWYRIEIGTNFAALQLQPLAELYRNLIEASASAISERDAAIEERDARFTEDQIRALSADYTIGLNEAGNVQMKFNLFESADLATFAPRTVNPESVSVVDGKICLEFAPADDAAFFRFSVQ